MIDILNSTQVLEPITLREMDTVKLMNRTDTKFAFHANLLSPILENAKLNYFVLDIENTRIPSYKTLYFDTASHDLFIEHHNDHNNRFKVRIRNYVESKLFFLEIKKKVNGRTDKIRKKIDGFYDQLTLEHQDFISKFTNDHRSLQKTLWNGFNRITLVNKSVPERITIDFNLNFSNEKVSYSMDNIVIAEVKQERVNLHSPFVKILKSFGIRETSLSKYCIGSLYCYEGLKYNNFKEKLLKIEKIKKAA